MFYKMIERMRDRWYASSDCTVTDLVGYMIQRGHLRDAQIEAIKQDLVERIIQDDKGKLLTYYETTISEAVCAVANMLDLLGGGNPLRLSQNELTHYRGHKAVLAAKDSLDLPHKLSSLQFMVDRRSSLPAATQAVFKETTDNAANHLFHILGLLPVFYIRDSGKTLKTVYKLEDVQKELSEGAKGQSSLLFDLVKLIEIPQEDFLLAVQSGTEGRQTLLLYESGYSRRY